MNALSCGKELSVSWTFSSELLRQKQGNRKATHDYDEQEESRNERAKNTGEAAFLPQNFPVYLLEINFLYAGI